MTVRFMKVSGTYLGTIQSCRTNEETSPSMMDECPGTAVGNSMKQGRDQARLERTPSIDVVITSDKSKWTRCPLLK